MSWQNFCIIISICHHCFLYCECLLLTPAKGNLSGVVSLLISYHRDLVDRKYEKRTSGERILRECEEKQEIQKETWK